MLQGNLGNALTRVSSPLLNTSTQARQLVEIQVHCKGEFYDDDDPAIGDSDSGSACSCSGDGGGAGTARVDHVDLLPPVARVPPVAHVPPATPPEATLIFCYQLFTERYINEENVDNREHLITLMNWIEGGFLSYV
jgi:hypothetical protein